MKMAIDIDESDYRFITKTSSIPFGINLVENIKNGKPLPKGHGRLIDADIMKKIDSIQRGDFNSIETIRNWVDIQPTIIEAEEEKLNDK